MKEHYWRLPEKIDEVLPPAARHLEILRRTVLDTFHTWGYEYIIPPLIEYLDSLLVGTGPDLELQTFKSVDLLSGRLLGVRPDITAQAARIDANSLLNDGPQRLCYAGSVVHANPAGVGQSRNPLLAGAELFGSAATEADAEIVSLMVEVLKAARIEKPIIELGHVGIYRTLVSGLNLNAYDEQSLFDAVQMKSPGEIERALSSLNHNQGIAELLMRLTDQIGGEDILDRARQELAAAPKEILAALDELALLTELIKQNSEEIEIRFDLSELAGYGYHTGIVFAAYSDQFGSSIARGGRYDSIGKAYGRARPATGFDVNLKTLTHSGVAEEGRILAPAMKGLDAVQRAKLGIRIRRLREDGKRVVVVLDPYRGETRAGDQSLNWLNGEWHLGTVRHESTSENG